jgi:hypothetical protein
MDLPHDQHKSCPYAVLCVGAPFADVKCQIEQRRGAIKI